MSPIRLPERILNEQIAITSSSAIQIIQWTAQCFKIYTHHMRINHGWTKPLRGATVTHIFKIFPSLPFIKTTYKYLHVTRQQIAEVISPLDMLQEGFDANKK